MTELITYIFEFVTMIISFLMVFLVLNRKKHSEVPLGNIFLALGATFLGIYALTTIIYSLIGEKWAIIVFMKIGMVSVLMAVLFLFYTMQILIYSSKWFKVYRISFLIPLIITLIIFIAIIFTDFIEVIDAATAETHFDPILYNIFAAMVAFLLIYSAFSIYYFGIRKSTGDSRKKMQLFFIGLIFFIGGLIADVIGNIIEIEVLFDTLLFVLLSIGVIFGSLAFIEIKSKE